MPNKNLANRRRIQSIKDFTEKNPIINEQDEIDEETSSFIMDKSPTQAR